MTSSPLSVRKQFVILSVALVLIVAVRGTERLSAEDVQSYRSGHNLVEVRTYNERDIDNLQPPAKLLRESWDVRGDVRWDIVATLGLLSKMVYDDYHEMLDYTLRSMGFAQWVAIRNKSMAAHAITDGESAVIVFRGTDPLEWEDWRKNFRAGTIRYERAGDHRFHEGFFLAYDSVQDEVMRFLGDRRPKRLWLTGHSLGGAMATLAAIDIDLAVRQLPDATAHERPVLVTFGQPRVADSGGAIWIDQQLDGRYARFVQGDDAVPRLPPTRLLGYAHAGRLITLHGGRAEAADSTVVTGLQPLYCNDCGGVTAIAAVEVYQAHIEGPPLTEAQFEEFFPSLQATPAGPTNQNLDDLFGLANPFLAISFPRYIRDHFIDGYLQAIRDERDGGLTDLFGD